MKKFLFMLSLIPFATNVYSQKGYEKSIEVGASIGVGEYSNTSFGVSMINGYRLNDYLFIGAGLGIGYSNLLNGVNIDKYKTTTEYRTDAYLIPVYANIKANFSKSNISPFFRLNIGYTFDLNQYIQDAPGLMIEPAIGVDFKINEKNIIYTTLGFNLQNTAYSYTRNLGTTDKDWEVTTKSEMLKAASIKIGIKF